MSHKEFIEKKERSHASLKKSINEINEFNPKRLHGSAFEIATLFANDSLADMSENRKKQIKDLNALLLKLTMESNAAMAALTSIICLIHNFKEKAAIEKMGGIRTASPEDLSEFFDESLALLKSLELPLS